MFKFHAPFSLTWDQILTPCFVHPSSKTLFNITKQGYPKKQPFTLFSQRYHLYIFGGENTFCDEEPLTGYSPHWYCVFVSREPCTNRSMWHMWFSSSHDRKNWYLNIANTCYDEVKKKGLFISTQLRADWRLRKMNHKPPQGTETETGHEPAFATHLLSQSLELVQNCVGRKGDSIVYKVQNDSQTTTHTRTDTQTQTKLDWFARSVNNVLRLG